MSEFDYNKIDDLLHSRIRTAIMAVLVSVEEADFSFIKERINATDGNLSVHMKKLEEAKYVKIKKKFVNNKPHTSYSVTEKGRNAFQSYIEHLENILKPNNKS